MTYNSSSQKNKIPKADLENKNQTNAISLQDWTNAQIEASVDNAQPRNQNVPLSNQWDSDWILMTPITIEETTLTVYSSWKVVIGTINKNWVSKFQAEIVCKNGINGEGDNQDFQIGTTTYFSKFIGWEFEDLESNPTSDIKTVSLVASLMIVRSYPNHYLPNFYSKLLLKYVDKTNRD